MPIGNGSFDEGIDYLIEEVGYGTIVAGCLVDQPYAQDQHETPYRHKQGDRNYLGGPLMENAFPLVEDIARSVITENGSGLTDAMIETAEKMSGFVNKNAPVHTGRLKTSGSPWVTSAGAEVYRRPPVSSRDEDEQPGSRRRT